MAKVFCVLDWILDAADRFAKKYGRPDDNWGKACSMGTNQSPNRDHARFSPEKYREVDEECAQAEQEMFDAEEQLRLVHERRERKKKQGKLFG